MPDLDVSHEYQGILKPGEQVREMPNLMRYFVSSPEDSHEEANKRKQEVQAAFQELLEQEDL